MSELLGNRQQQTKLYSLLIIVVVLAAAAFLGLRSSRTLLVLLVGGIGALILLQRPALGLLVLVAAALMAKVNIGTGSDVSLNPVTLLIPAVLVIWLLDMTRTRQLHIVRSRTYLPLLLLLLMGTASLLIGNVTWDPFVPHPANFLLVQLAQLAIYFLSALAFLLAANMVRNEEWLRYLTWAFLAIGGSLTILYLWSPSRTIVNQFATAAFNRAPLWMLLTAIAGGQLLFNRSLAIWKQLLLVLILIAVGYYSLQVQREVVSIWIGVIAAMSMLLWLRLPRLRWLFLAALLALLVAGVLFPAIYQFAGGDAEWQLSGISRMDLSRRVLSVTMRNPITGLGPASYRVYASVEPLIWRGGSRIWVGAVVSSHNNYVDIFSFFGLIGLAIFLWFMVEVALLGLRMRKRFSSGFNSGYASGILAAWAGTMVIMFFADWFLPFVYNVGYPGFQASVLVWIFMGGLVAMSGFPEK